MFAESMPEMITIWNNLMELLIFPEKVIILWDGGINSHNCRHWTTLNHH